MKNLDLAALGVEEMSEVEMREVDGGFWREVAALLAGALVSEDLDGLGSSYREGRSSVRQLF